MLTRNFYTMNMQLAVIGAEGVGKTTLLSAISHLETGFLKVKKYEKEDFKQEIVDVGNGVSLKATSLEYETD